MCAANTWMAQIIRKFIRRRSVKTVIQKLLLVKIKPLSLFHGSNIKIGGSFSFVVEFNFWLRTKR